MKLSKDAVVVLFKTLRGAKPKGLAVRLHAKIDRIIIAAGAATRKDIVTENGEVETWLFKAAEIPIIQKDQIKYIKDLLEKEIDGGITGALAQGCVDLDNEVSLVWEAVKNGPDA